MNHNIVGYNQHVKQFRHGNPSEIERLSCIVQLKIKSGSVNSIHSYLAIPLSPIWESFTYHITHATYTDAGSQYAGFCYAHSIEFYFAGVIITPLVSLLVAAVTSVIQFIFFLQSANNDARQDVLSPGKVIDGVYSVIPIGGERLIHLRVNQLVSGKNVCCCFLVSLFTIINISSRSVNVSIVNVTNLMEQCEPKKIGRAHV